MYLLLLGHVESDGGVGECCDRPAQPRRYPRGEREDWVAIRIHEVDARCACQKSSEFEVWGLEFGVWGLGFRVYGLGFGVQGLGFKAYGFGFRAYGFGF